MEENRNRELYKTIGRTIKGVRKRLRITQNDLALKCGLKRPSIVLIEQGNQLTPLDRLYDIAIALNVDVHDLLPKQYGDYSIEALLNTDGLLAKIAELESKINKAKRILSYIGGEF